MPSATTPLLTLRAALAAALTVLFCSGTSLAIVGWAPGVPDGVVLAQK